MSFDRIKDIFREIMVCKIREIGLKYLGMVLNVLIESVYIFLQIIMVIENFCFMLGLFFNFNWEGCLLLYLWQGALGVLIRDREQ